LYQETTLKILTVKTIEVGYFCHRIKFNGPNTIYTTVHMKKSVCERWDDMVAQITKNHGAGSYRFLEDGSK
jgi:hypothetical protein